MCLSVCIVFVCAHLFLFVSVCLYLKEAINHLEIAPDGGSCGETWFSELGCLYPGHGYKVFVYVNVCICICMHKCMRGQFYFCVIEYTPGRSH